MLKRLSRNIKVENAIQGIDEILDEIMDIKIDFQESQSISYFEIQNSPFQSSLSNTQQALKALSEAEKQLNIAKSIFLKQSR